MGHSELLWKGGTSRIWRDRGGGSARPGAGRTEPAGTAGIRWAGNHWHCRQLQERRNTEGIVLIILVLWDLKQRFCSYRGFFLSAAWGRVTPYTSSLSVLPKLTLPWLHSHPASCRQPQTSTQTSSSVLAHRYSLLSSRQELEANFPLLQEGAKPPAAWQEGQPGR